MAMKRELSLNTKSTWENGKQIWMGNNFTFLLFCSGSNLLFFLVALIVGRKIIYEAGLPHAEPVFPLDDERCDEE